MIADVIGPNDAGVIIAFFTLCGILAGLWRATNKNRQQNSADHSDVAHRLDLVMERLDMSLQKHDLAHDDRQHIRHRVNSLHDSVTTLKQDVKHLAHRDDTLADAIEEVVQVLDVDT